MTKIIKNKVLIIGTRPEAIKLAPVVLELKRRQDLFDFGVRVTIQHCEILDQVFALFGLTPDYLNMSPGETLAQVTPCAMERLHKVFSREKSGVVLVHGDLNNKIQNQLTR